MTSFAPSWGTRIAAGVSAAVVIAAGLALPAQAAVTAEDLTFDKLSAPLPDADLLDVDFTGGTAVDHSAKAWPLKPGSAATIALDEVLGKNVAVGTAGADSAWQTPSGTVRAWTSTWVYTGGEIVAFEGRRYQAQWWTRGQQPGQPLGPWLDLGAL